MTVKCVVMRHWVNFYEGGTIILLRTSDVTVGHGYNLFFLLRQCFVFNP